jgi:hypothetical protein
MANVAFPELTDEEYALVRERVLREVGIEKVVSEKTEAVAPVAEEDVYVYTNTQNADLTIDDLGIKSPSGQFSPEVFSPYETKNLREIYSRRELKASKYLLVAVKKGFLKKGEIKREELEKNTDVLTKLARNNPEGSFTDPVPVGGGDDHFDKKYRELQERDEKEDKETRKR